MLRHLFTIFDLPLVLILVIVVLFSIFFIKNIYNLFLTIFIGIFLIIFIASIVLTQQIYLGEFLVISIFFILAVVFFLFNLNLNNDNIYIFEEKISKIKIIISVFAFLTITSIILLNFDKINKSGNNLIIKNTIVSNDLTLNHQKEDKEFDEYIENISLLNQNKIFQKLTHIIMFYICLVIILYFFNRRESDEG